MSGGLRDRVDRHPKRTPAKTSDKVLAATLPLFSAWCAKYAWGWLAGLEVIGAAGLGAWKITNVAKTNGTAPWDPPEFDGGADVDR